MVSILHKNAKDVSGLVIFGLISLSYGFGVYYLLPLSLVSFNFSLATSIFFAILFGMILALGLLSINLMPFLNVMVTRVLLFLEAKSYKQLVLKNLIAHKERNQMTTLMFSLTLGFIIFLSIVAHIPHARHMQDIVKEMGVNSLLIEQGNLPLYEVEQLLKKHTYAFESWGPSTQQIYNKYDMLIFSERLGRSSSRNEIDHVKVSDFARRKSEKTGLVGVSPSLGQTIESEFI